MRSGRIVTVVLTVTLAGTLPAACGPKSADVSHIEPVEFPEPVAVDPGSQLAFGDAVWVEQSSGGSTTLLGVAVLDIVEGETWYWMNAENGADWVDYTPFFVIVQRQWLAPDAIYDISLYPLLSDGTPALLLEQGSEGAYNPATCDDVGIPQPADSLQRIDCMLVAAREGEVVTSVYYDGTFADPASSLDPTAYLDAPVTWSAD